jgi:hypothetical protein
MKARVSETPDVRTAKGLLRLVAGRISQECFGDAFPFMCQDGQGNAGTDAQQMKDMMAAYGVIWPEDFLDHDDLPEDGLVLDLLEFSYEHIAAPDAYTYHSFWHHHHYSYDQEAGRSKLEAEVNRLFERNGMAFELRKSMREEPSRA